MHCFTYPLILINRFILPLFYFRYPSGKQIQGGIYKLLTLTFVRKKTQKVYLIPQNCQNRTHFKTPDQPAILSPAMLIRTGDKNGHAGQALDLYS
jgi:hypothetical protein